MRVSTIAVIVAAFAGIGWYVHSKQQDSHYVTNEAVRSTLDGEDRAIEHLDTEKISSFLSDDIVLHVSEPKRGSIGSPTREEFIGGFDKLKADGLQLRVTSTEPIITIERGKARVHRRVTDTLSKEGSAGNIVRDEDDILERRGESVLITSIDSTKLSKTTTDGQTINY